MEEKEKPGHRVRIRLKDGSEFEAEGTPEFVAAERREFAALTLPAPAFPSAAPPAGSLEAQALGASPQPPWESILESRGRDQIQLRAKLREHTEKEACLILLAASGPLLRTPKPTAAQLARWLRASGYPIGRVDRAIQDCLDKGEILASGSRRARRYELSTPGLAKAHGLAYQLAVFLRRGA